MTTGERIKNRRIELGMTQEELANKLGYSGKSSISKIESAADDITLKKIEKFAKGLNTTREYLLGWVSDPEQSIEELLKNEDSQLIDHQIRQQERLYAYSMMFDMFKMYKELDKDTQDDIYADIERKYNRIKKSKEQ